MFGERDQLWQFLMFELKVALGVGRTFGMCHSASGRNCAAFVAVLYFQSDLAKMLCQVLLL